MLYNTNTYTQTTVIKIEITNQLKIFRSNIEYKKNKTEMREKKRKKTKELNNTAIFSLIQIYREVWKDKCRGVGELGK